MINTISDANLANWLEAAGRYFENRDTGGEDMAHWSNVFSAENCREAANRIRLSAQQREPVVRVKELEWPPRCPLGQRVHNRPALVNYTIAHYGGDIGDAIYRWAEAHSPWSEALATYEAAKSAAQADYEARIMAAIEITSSDGVAEGSKLYASPAHPALGCQVGRNGKLAPIAKPVAGVESRPSEASTGGRSQPSPDVDEEAHR